MIYLGPKIWRTRGGPGDRPYWDLPPGARSMLDLSSPAVCAVAGNSAGDLGGEALFDVRDGVSLPAQWTAIEDVLTPAQRAALGVTSTSLRNALIERWFEGGEGNHATKHSPAMPYAGKFRLILGNRDIEVAADVVPGWTAIRAWLKSRLESVTDATHRKRLIYTTLMQGLGVAPTREKAQEWLGIDEAPERPRTIRTCSFTGADQATLHNADDGSSWSEVNGTAWRNLSNQARYDGEGPGDSIVRLDYTFGSVNHYAQFVLAARTIVSGNMGVGPCVRFAAAAETFYVWHVQNDGTNEKLYKDVAGAITALTADQAVTQSLPDTTRCNVTGTTLEGIWNGSTIVSITDSAINGVTVGGTRTGMYAGSDSASNTLDVDDFEASDGIAAILPDRRFPRGLNRGLLRGAA